MNKTTLLRSLIGLFSVLITLLSATLTQAQTPPFASVKSIEIDGSGCEAGSANALITSDLNFLSVLYDRFAVEIGKGTEKSKSKSAEKKCTINVTVQVPAGWDFTFDSVDYRGVVQLPNQMTLAYQLISAEVYGGRGIAFDQNLMRGPKNQNFVTTVRNKGLLSLLNGVKNQVDQLSNFGLANCSNQTQDVKIKIKSIIGVRNLLGELTRPAVRLIVDSTDASFRQNLKLNWKRCG